MKTIKQAGELVPGDIVYGDRTKIAKRVGQVRRVTYGVGLVQVTFIDLDKTFALTFSKSKLLNVEEWQESQAV